MPDPSSDDLAAALAAVRRYCGWHVSPVETEQEMVLDGPGSPVLLIPTLRLVDLVSVVEDGVELDVTALRFTADGRVYKKDRGWWCDVPAGIEVVATHGFAEAPDFDQAVAKVASSIASGLRDDPSMVRKKVDDVEYQWSDASVGAYGGGQVDLYKLEKQP